MTNQRTTWILAEGSTTEPRLGPMIRLHEIARQARLAGTAPTLVLNRQLEATEVDGVPVLPLTPSSLAAIRPGDATIVSSQQHPSVVRRLVDLGIAFDLDLYNVAPYEHVEKEHPGVSRWKVFQSRRRLSRRYRLLLERAERFYLSNTQQLSFLGGNIFSRADTASCRLVSRLPERCMFLPMGCHPVSTSTPPNPYPASLAGRPIYLWGGGIWKWFDTTTLLEAFRILAERGSSAALFFLVKHNPVPSPDHDGPIQTLLETGNRYGLIGKNIFFAQEKVGPTELPGYLAHCHAGIMTNPQRLESFGSWRTRLLDLIPHGKPLVTSGYDPLSHEMALAGACSLVPPGDPSSLADAIEALTPERAEAMSKAMSRLLERHCWDNIFLPLRERLSDSSAFATKPNPLPWSEQLLFALGL